MLTRLSQLVVEPRSAPWKFGISVSTTLNHYATLLSDTILGLAIVTPRLLQGPKIQAKL
jgi:hypothetical protein